MGGSRGFGFGGMGFGGYGMVPPPSAFDEYYKAYSVAVMGGNERSELLYGGKIVMPPSALAKLSAMEIPSPWTFHLRNPRNPKVNQTHAGVLEFIADEGIVHLPAWMMKALEISEGDPIRLTGAELPKGKMVKIQAQSTAFLEVSDPKAVLESALRFYSCLTKGDIIEITYNSLVFEFLIMETTPEGAGISVIDTDLEVDFATPVGYVEPPRPAPAPIPTMADKLKIDLGGTTTGSAGSSRSVSRASGGSGESGPLESFTGVGQSLSGKKVKGKGLAKKIEEVDPKSRINRNGGNRIVTPDSLTDDRKVPAALVLPEGKFFFGYKYIPFDSSKQPKKVEAPKSPDPFQGQGETLRKTGGISRPQPVLSGQNGTAPESVAVPSPEEKIDPWAKLGSGNTLRPKRPAPSMPTPEPAHNRVRSNQPAAPPPPSNVIDATMLDEDDFGFVDSDDDEHEVIEIDSD
ncbi:ubiquitin fusion degradation protein UFD1-domain-containing protein [Kockovaella imperatae]|uniref:Ubiquitin fusion degradation protein UFD1-domain-containing protein n=1 Tax=Kockovaella imperatae TaxID=4999 RepID=A0A1Y1UJ69_9TREE|nr:ubiquitin fusion degradation protein UFD1-domain-containing protein [Kockovaella imperatae]ORX37534.1 ubiquitin fusion degradation protein UFD1-domain-containing protein [Kockovaella imperatae]